MKGPLILRIVGQDTEFQGEETVLAIFQRHTGQDSRWTYGMDNCFVEKGIQQYHYRNDHVGSPIEPCANCPLPGGNKVNPKFLKQLLERTHPLIEIPGLGRHRLPEAADGKRDE
jgi:hypothetical protein